MHSLKQRAPRVGLLLLALCCTPRTVWTQRAPIFISEVDTMSQDQLLRTIRGECTNPPDCESYHRREAARRLAEESPEIFLDLAPEVYKKNNGLSGEIAALYWEYRVSQTPPEERTSLLWKIFHGDVEGLIPATEKRSVKNFGVDRLCERGDHDEFPVLRDHLASQLRLLVAHPRVRLAHSHVAGCWNQTDARGGVTP